MTYNNSTHSNKFSAASVKADVKVVKHYGDDLEDYVDPQNRDEIKQGAKQCRAILKDADDWVSGPRLRRDAGLNENQVRNFTTILSIIGDEIDIKESDICRYKFREKRVVKQGTYNNSNATERAKRMERI